MIMRVAVGRSPTFPAIIRGDRSMDKVVHKRKLHEKESSYDYWRTRPIVERLQAIETLRRQYMEHVGYVEHGLQRVCRVVKRARR
jgi:hypothetical protein